MKFFRPLLGKLWRALFFLNGILSFILLYPVFHVLLQTKKWFNQAFKLKRFWAKIIINTVGIRYREIYAGKQRMTHPCVICPNHASYLDIVTTYITVSGYYHFMGKAELKKVPLFNRFFARMNILVDRGSIMAAHRAFTRAGNDIDKGISIAIFPEATIPACAPELGRLKNGAFKLAIEKQIPLVPVVFLDNWKILPDGPLKKLGGTPGITRAVIHDPIPTIGLTENDVDDLKNRYSLIMRNTLAQYHCVEEADAMKLKYK